MRLAGGSSAPPTSPEVGQLLARAFALLEQGDLGEAHTVVDAALALDPDSSSTHSLRGILFEREGRVAEAIREFELVVARNPDSPADRAKLNALRGNVTMSLPQRRWTSQQITIASALAAGLVVFGGGLMVVTQSGNTRRETRSTPTTQLTPANAVALSAPPSAGPAAPRPLRPLPTAPAPKMGAFQGPPVPAPLRAAHGGPTPPTFTTPGRSLPLRPSPPIGPVGLPQMGAAGKTANGGLPPAAIGEVVPLPQTPAVAPGGPAIAAATVPPAGTGTPTGAGSATTAPPSAEGPKPAAPVEPKPRVEPLEPETGFIKIEPLKGAGENRANPAEPAKPVAPSISVDIASSGGDEAAIAEAQRAQRNAFNAARVANLEDAERHYRQAASLYELLVKRGGSSARQAREGLEACKKALAALH
jgi:tetratricopeptide (TPR) repeat protein